ncbi:MAG TPA: hypothetical protein VJR03_08005 [Nitrospira sp.]|nr:hypothetical protein [Nitrospira sp.]
MPVGRRQRDDNVAKVGSGLIEAMRRLSLPKGKGKNVGAPIFMPEPTVQPTHPPVAHEGERHFGRGLSEELQDGLRQP